MSATSIVIAERHGQIDGLCVLATAALLYAHLWNKSPIVNDLCISLFLIVGGLLTAHALLGARSEGQVSVPNYYARRLLRLAPALTVLFAVSYFFDTDGFRQSAAWHALQLSNVYFALSGEWRPWVVYHLASLNTLELFFLFGPIAIVFASRRVLWLLAIGVLVTALLLRANGGHLGLTGSWTSLVLNFDPLALGVLLYLLMQIPAVAVVVRSEVALLLALVALSLPLFFWDGFAESQSYALLAEAALAVIVGGAFAGYAGPLGRLLGLAPMRGAFRICYGVFVYHPLIWWLVVQARPDFFERSPRTFFFVSLLSVTVATISWYVLEQPISRLKWYFPTTRPRGLEAPHASLRAPTRPLPVDRLLGADFIRAAACLLVLAHHLSQRMSWTQNLDWMEWLRFGVQIGGFGVSMFFVLSGFLLARPFWVALDDGANMPSLRTFVVRRAARILPAYWLSLSVSFVLGVTVFGVAFNPFLLGRFLSGLFLVADWSPATLFPVEVNSPLWSISLEVTSYVLLAFAMLAMFAVEGRFTNRIWTRIVWLSVIALALVAHTLFVRYFPSDISGSGWDHGLIGGAKTWMPLFNPFGFFAVFAVGALAAGLQLWLSRWRHWVFDVLCLWALALLSIEIYLQSGAKGTESYGMLGVPHAFPFLQITVGLVLIFGPSTTVVGRLLDNPVVRYLATISFGIYVWHYLVLELVRTYWPPDLAPGQLSGSFHAFIVYSVVVGLTVLIAHLSYVLLERPIILRARGADERGVRPVAHVAA